MIFVKCLSLFLMLTLTIADLLIQLPNGTIRGKESITLANKTYYSFEKVPYAAPPIGSLRFKAPVPPQNWDGVLDATSNRVVCYQVNGDYPNESEDCLYLNIYTPQHPNETDHAPLPVMFYIHGGGFIVGACLDVFCGPDFLIEYDVIIVTITYRLGPFGFLSTQDLIIPGNNGLKDQHLAIKWTHENIHLFGGDSQKITILGQSAGAASVTYQLLYQKSEGLFWGGICQSGSFLSPWSFQRAARQIAFKTASFINSSLNFNNDSEALLEYLLNVPATVLDAASFQVHLSETYENRQINQGYFYAPVIEPDHEEAFITKKMYVDLKRGNFVKVPIMIGITSEESLEDATDTQVLQTMLKTYDENLSRLVPIGLHIKDSSKKKTAGSVIKSLYTRSQFQTNLGSGVRYFSDMAFTRSIIKHAELQSKFTDVYFYQFSYDGDMGNVPITVPGARQVAHTEDFRYMWRISSGIYNYDNTNVHQFPESDVITHYRLLKMWTNFAKTQNPNAITLEDSELLQNVTWPTVNSGKPKIFYYLDIDENLEVKYYPKISTYLGWNLVFNVFAEDDLETY